MSLAMENWRRIIRFHYLQRVVPLKPALLLIFPFLVVLVWLELGRNKQLNQYLSNPNVSIYSFEANKKLAKMNFEHRVRNLLPMHSDASHQLRTSSLLCCTFIKWESLSLNLLVHNINHTQRHCDWLVIVYDTQDNSIQLMEKGIKDQLKNFTFNSSEMMNNIKILLAPEKERSLAAFQDICQSYVSRFLVNHQSSRFKPCEVLPNSSMTLYNPSMYAKASLFTLLLEDLPRYRYVWTFLHELNLDSFFRILTCSFRHPPIVSQPLIYESTQSYKYLLKEHWGKTKALASEVGFIEIQAPIFDAVFLEYFIMSFILPVLPAMVVLGGDWGIDEMFCSAAKEFVNHDKKRLHDHPICAVILNNMSVHHHNRQEIVNIVGKSLRNAVNGVLMKIVRKHFNHYAKHGKQYFRSPFHVGTNFKRSYQLNSSCRCFLCQDNLL